MTNIERMAKEAGIELDYYYVAKDLTVLAKFAALVAEDAACIAYGEADEAHPMCDQSITARAIGKAIRAKYPQFQSVSQMEKTPEPGKGEG